MHSSIPTLSPGGPRSPIPKHLREVMARSGEDATHLCLVLEGGSVANGNGSSNSGITGKTPLITWPHAPTTSTLNPPMSSVSVLPQPGSMMTFWINAFIPRDIFGAMRILHEGDYRGLSIVSKAPCYLTDQRNFSNDLCASSRMHSLVKVDLTASEPVLTQHHRCDDLIECDPVSGEVLQKRAW